MMPHDAGSKIALLVPWKNDGATGREENWEWLKSYWTYHLPGAQLVIGTDNETPFSKTCAINQAFNRADPSNDILVLLDADCYIAPTVILECAERIRSASIWQHRMWFVPYRFLYRLTDTATAQLIASSVEHPIQFSVPHTMTDVSSTEQLAKIGHHFGALIQIMPRDALIEIGGMEARARGWGSDDINNVRALDTLWGIHSTTKNEVMTLFHLSRGDIYLRMWEGQTATGVNNSLSHRYRQARRDPLKMKHLVSEWMSDPALAAHRIYPEPEWFSSRQTERDA